MLIRMTRTALVGYLFLVFRQSGCAFLTPPFLKDKTTLVSSAVHKCAVDLRASGLGSVVKSSRIIPGLKKKKEETGATAPSDAGSAV